MAKTKGTHFVISAGLTESGAPAYMKADGGWSAQLTDALCVQSEEEALKLAAKADAEHQAVVCDPYLFMVNHDGQKIEPTSAREAIRATGPTVAVRRPD